MRAKSNGLLGALTTSDDIIIGNCVEPDWTEEFNTENDFKLFTVVDANDDGKTWHYRSDGKLACSYYSSEGTNDDWLFTPPIHLTPGHLYKITFRAKNCATSSYKNTMEVKWGTDTTAEAMSNTLLETTAPPTDFMTYSYDILTTEDRNYYIGFHDNTATPDQFYIAVDSIVVEKGSTTTAPSAATNLKVTPDAQGALSATIAFTAPATNIQGENINKIDSIQIKRDGILIGTINNVIAGSEQTFTDGNVPTNGNHTYEVLPYLNGELGLRASVLAFVGQDIPVAPQNIQLIDNTNDVLSIWDRFPETGQNGGYVNPSDVAVSIFNVQEQWYGYEVADSITTSAKGATTVELPQDPEKTTSSDGKTQSLYFVAARADGAAGNSQTTVAGPVVIGPSIQLPFKESFSNGKTDNGFAWTHGNDQLNNNSYAASWILDTDNSSDGDGGCAAWHAYSVPTAFDDIHYTVTPGDEVSFNTPKISLRGATNPVLYFSLYKTEDDPASLDVIVQTPDGVKHTLKSIDLSNSTSNGWTTEAIDLSQFTSERYVIVCFNGIANGEYTNIGLDDINVFNQLEYNLTANNISAPDKITAGKTGKIDVTVENFGAHPVQNYDVVLYSNDEAIDTVTVNKPLAVLSKDTVSLDLPISINQEGNVNVKAQVVYENDLDEDDNTTETKTIIVNPSKYAKVNDLNAKDDNDCIELNWSVPTVPEPEYVTEDFENYDAFATQFGDWTTIDGDKGLAGGFFQNYPYPGQGTAFAFDIFNPNAITSDFNVLDSNPGMAPHSGNQFAAAPYVFDADNNSIDADNWLISPELPGKAQTISFYAYNLAFQSQDGNNYYYPETFDVLYSTTGQDIDDFVKIESDVADGTNIVSEATNWKQFTVNLPEGANYFAIHHNTNGSSNFLFGLDDITFEEGYLGANDSIVAYNIYRDGKFIGTIDGNKTTFTDGSADDGNHVYNITVVYQDKYGNRNESGFSNDASITVVTGIDSIHADKEGNYNVYTIDGKTVMLNSKTLNGLKSGVYIINDKKYIIR